MTKLNDEQEAFLAIQYDKLVREHTKALEEIEAHKERMKKIEYKLWELAELIGVDFDHL